MRQARRNIFIGVLILLFAAFTWVVLKSREPSYHGKTLTEWLEEISNSDVHEYTDADPEAINAIRQIGTRGLPTLLRLLASKDSRLKEWILENRNQPWMINFHLRSADELHNMAVAGFEILGSKAQPAVPELITLLHDQDRIIRIEASFCLGYVGPAAQAAVPDLIKELEREERDNNLAPEVYALRSIGSPADSNCIPALTAALTCALTNYSYDNKIMAQAALINLKPASISTFIEQLKNTSDERAWRKAAMVTAFCGTNAMPAVPLLITGLSQTNYLIQSTALTALRELHLQPETCIPVLVPLLEATNRYDRRDALYAIGKFGIAAKSAVPRVLACLSDRDYEVRRFATNTLRFIDPETAVKLGIK